MTMIARVAQAIAIVLDNSEHISGDCQVGPQGLDELARAALVAMREPTEQYGSKGWSHERAEKLRRRLISFASNLHYAIKDQNWGMVEQTKREADETIRQDY